MSSQRCVSRERTIFKATKIDLSQQYNRDCVALEEAGAVLCEVSVPEVCGVMTFSSEGCCCVDRNDPFVLFSLLFFFWVVFSATRFAMRKI